MLALTILFWLLIAIACNIFMVVWGSHYFGTKSKRVIGRGTYKLFKQELQKRTWISYGFMGLKCGSWYPSESSEPCDIDWWMGYFNFGNKFMLLRPIAYLRVFFLIYRIARKYKRANMYDWKSEKDDD